MRKTAEAVIIGGGIQGLSLAYYLAEHGMTDICLVEMRELGSGSSGRSATIIGHVFPTEKTLPLTRLSFAALGRFHEELGADPCYEPIGCLVLGGREAAPRLYQRATLLSEMGVENALVSNEEILRLTPGLDLDGIVVGLYTPHDGGLDPHSIMMAYAAQARRRGVEVLEGVRATGISIQDSGVTGVHTTAGFIATPRVVNAAGFRSREVASWVGMRLPITNLKRHIFVTGPLPAYAASFPFTYEWEAGWYIRREGPGLLVGMGAVESDEEDPQVDWPFLDAVIEHSIRRAPALADAGVKTGWAGLRPVTPDDDPILGEAPHLKGFYNDCGWGGHGVMHASGAGLVLAELIADGRAMSVDLRPYSVGRFEGWLANSD